MELEIMFWGIKKLSLESTIKANLGSTGHAWSAILFNSQQWIFYNELFEFESGVSSAYFELCYIPN